MKKNTLYYHSSLDVGKDGNVGVVDRAYMHEAAAVAVGVQFKGFSHQRAPTLISADLPMQFVNAQYRGAQKLD